MFKYNSELKVARYEPNKLIAWIEAGLDPRMPTKPSPLLVRLRGMEEEQGE